MKKLIILAMVLLFAGIALGGPYQQKQIQFVDERGLPRTDVTSVAVYNAGTVTASTLYKDRAGGTSVTNPITTSSTATTLTQYNGLVYWFSRAQSCDIVVQAGVELKFEGINASVTRIVVPTYIDESANRQRGGYSRFMARPISVATIGAGAATGSAGDENVMYVGDVAFEYHALGTQTILSPDIAATGLDIGMDQTANDGVEIGQGITAWSRAAFTVGTDPAFHLKVKMTIADVTGTDDCAVGFHKAEAYQANIDDYNDAACLNAIGGAINIETILNGGATTTTDTTDTCTDTNSVSLEVYVSDAGVVTYKIDGAAPTTTAAFTFDDAEVVVPFIYFLHHTDVAGVVVLTEYDCGLD